MYTRLEAVGCSDMPEEWTKVMQFVYPQAAVTGRKVQDWTQGRS